MPGFTQWQGGPCTECPKANVGLILLMLIGSLLGLMTLRLLSQDSSSETKVLFFFLATARMLLTDDLAWTRWLRALDFDSALFVAGGSGLCIMPLSSLQQMGVELALPLLLVLE